MECMLHPDLGLIAIMLIGRKYPVPLLPEPGSWLQLSALHIFLSQDVSLELSPTQHPFATFPSPGC